MLTIHSNKLSPHFSETLAYGFLRSVMSYSNDNALFVGGRYYTYQELLGIVLQIHEEIPTLKSYSFIGVYCSDDIYSYASLLAINLYGAAYVPLNSKFPPSKNKKIIELGKLDLIISSSDIEHLTEFADESEILDLTKVNWKLPNQQSLQISEEWFRKDFRKVDQAIAYVLFTSGSTGEPKGVPVSHSNVHHFFNYHLKNYDFNKKDKFLQVYELTFDVSVFSFFMPLMVGACCFILPSEGIKYLQTIDYLKRFEITILSMVPTALRYLERYFKEIKLDKLRYSFFSGDALYYELAVKWQQAIPNADIHNFYGPTETTIVCTRYVFDVQKSLKESEYGIVPLGKPFEGMAALIVDENNLPCEKGELCFSGTQVIDQYLNGSNAEQFFTHEQMRYYKTGDIVAYNEFGNLIFYGRTDSQVKVNGYRIELAEIENAIMEILETKVIVLCKKGKTKSNELIVFIEEVNFDKENLVKSLSKVLPSYMLPHVYHPIERFELTENGKVDKQSLLNFM